jgi:Tfp pilus assembly protein FimV
MSSRLLRLSALSAALVSTYAGAVGFGEVVLQSRVGEPLRAEVPLFVNPGEQIESACFSLNPIRNSDLPVVTAARTRLTRNGQNYRLIITGSKPIAEPIFVVSLRAGCGVDLQRDFVLMPQAPLMLADAFDDMPAAPVAVAPSRKSGNLREMRARDGDTLETIAESQAPDDIVEQRRLLAALKRANPNIAPEQLLPEGTTVRMPNLRQRIAAESDSAAEPAPSKPSRPKVADAPPAPPKPKKAVQREASAGAPSKGADRIVLGTPPDDLKAGEKAVAPSGVPSEVQERMLKLETTLQLLNQEVDKLNAALALTTEALAMQQKLQMAQTLQAQHSVCPLPDSAAAAWFPA